LPANLTAVKAYLEAMESRESWKNTYYAPELVIKGWNRHLAG
jgi:glutathione dehydrogenase/transferase